MVDPCSTTAAGAADVLGQDFVGAARPPERGRRLAARHVLPVAAGRAPAIATASTNLMLTDMVLAEKAFGIPGFMQIAQRSVRRGDVPVLLALSVTGAAFVVPTTTVLRAVLGRLDRGPRR